MPQLSSMSVPLSCPLYLDLGTGLQSASSKSHFEVHDQSRGMLDMNFLYENLVKGQVGMCQFNPNLLAESFNFYLNHGYRNGDKNVSPKSFSIESILGFPNQSPSKDVFCNQLAFSDCPTKNNHCPIPEFVSSPTNFRPAVGHALESCKVKDQLTISENANYSLAHTGGAVDKALSSLKNKDYFGLGRKSSKVFKASAKSMNSQSKSKRVRTIFTPEQLERLETEFERQQYMVGTGRHYLASTLNLSEAQVKVWFQNRRIKWRKQHLENQQDKCDQEEKELTL